MTDAGAPALGRGEGGGSTDIWLLRHAESANNPLPEREHRPDPRLTPLGRQQALRLAQALAAQGVQVVLSSPLLRSLETAEPLVAAAGCDWWCWADLAEMNRAHPGDGQAVEALRRAFPAVRYEAALRWPGHPGPESAAAAAARAARVVDRLGSAVPRGGRVAVVGHGTFNAFLLRAWLGAPQDGSVQVVQGNACIHHLRLATGAVHLCRYNDGAHLR